VKPGEAQLLQVLRVGRDTSLRGAGISLRDALAQIRYRELRASIGPEDLLPFIRANQEFMLDWVMYSEDKRTSGGWYLAEASRTIGRVGAPEDSATFSSLEEAVAEYVVRELDFWSSL